MKHYALQPWNQGGDKVTMSYYERSSACHVQSHRTYVIGHDKQRTFHMEPIPVTKWQVVQIKQREPNSKFHSFCLKDYNNL